MTPTGHFSAGRRLSPRQVPNKGWALMLKLLPWDVWAAGALAAGVVLAAIFDPAPIVFIVMVSIY